MTEPTEPRNVTPGAAEPDEFHRRFRRERDEGPEWAGWSWASGGRGFPLLGVLLVLIGVALLVQIVWPQVSVGTLLLLAIGLAFLAAWLFSRSWFSMVPGVLIAALGVAELIEDLALLRPAGEDVPGLASSALAIGFLIIWAIAAATGRRWTWPLWGAALFGLIGVVQFSARIAVPQLSVVLPIVVIVVGLLVLFNARRR